MTAKKSSKNKRGYYWVSDGETVAVPWRNYKEQCCDCGLVHRMNFKIIDGTLHIQTFRDKRSTAAVRQKFNFEKDNAE